jgi:hypothetical protein
MAPLALFRTYGSVRGAAGNLWPYRDPLLFPGVAYLAAAVIRTVIHGPFMPKLSDKQLSALLSIANIKIGFSCQGELGQFVDSWIVAECIAKRLIEYRTQKSVGHSWKWTEVEASVKYFELSTPDYLSAKKIFAGGSGRKVDRTPRQLRNAFLHGISEEILVEMNSKGRGFSEFLIEWRLIVTRG